MSASRDAEIRLKILDVLNESHPYAVPDETLLSNLNARMTKKVKRTEFDDHVLFLKKADLVEPHEGKLGDVNPRWVITEAGRHERKR